ncbi:MAG: GNAT family N-acetyltransferase [Alphaproteobacteria bacterium]|nr:GNAT family N-acetyltransferase [Alphaproteobacteria bacterium]
MDFLSFTTHTNSQWDKRIAIGLRHECEARTGDSEEFITHTIYAKIGDNFVGGIICEQHNEILWIDSLWVEIAFRKQGRGAQLVEQACLFGIQNKAKEVQLNTYFHEAHAFFLKWGFKDVAVIPNWKYGLTCYLMRKKL